MMPILCRLLQAALHFNENSRRAQAGTLAGEEHSTVSFPKYKQGGYAVREVKVDQPSGELTEKASAVHCASTVNILINNDEYIIKYVVLI